MAIKIVEVECPRCSAGEPEKVGEEQYRCAHCGAVFLVDRGTRAYQVVPVPSPAATAPPTKRGWLGGIIGLVILVAAVFGIINRCERAERRQRSLEWSRSYRSRSSSTTQRYTSPTPAIPRYTKFEPALAKIVSYRKNQVGYSGSDFWLVTYANVGKVPISMPSVVVSLFDADGRRIGEQTGYSQVKVLPPGGTAPVLVLMMGRRAFHRVEVKPSDPRSPSSYDRTPVNLTVVDSTVSRTPYRMKEVVGTIRNDTSVTATFVNVVVVGRNAKGELVSLANGYATSRNLAPKGETGFKVSTGTFEIETPERYEVFSFASQY